VAFAIAFVALLAMKTLVFNICTIEGNAFEPTLMAGDRVLINRWSYGLRIGTSDGFFGYGRLGRRPVSRGDLVAFENPRQRSQLLICRCTGLPGDTIHPTLQNSRTPTLLHSQNLTLVIPSLANCSDADYYWMEAIGDSLATDSRQLGFIPEECIVGRAFAILYSHDPVASILSGWRTQRTLTSTSHP